MAYIKLEVTIEDLYNSQLGDVEDKFREAVKDLDSKTFPGKVTDVTETDRSEDEEDEED